MGAHPDSSRATVALRECLAQPKDHITDGQAMTKETGERPKPTIVVAGDDSALKTVRTLHSPTNRGTTWSFTHLRVWNRKLLHSGWTGPADTVLSWAALL